MTLPVFITDALSYEASALPVDCTRRCCRHQMDMRTVPLTAVSGGIASSTRLRTVSESGVAPAQQCCAKVVLLSPMMHDALTWKELKQQVVIKSLVHVLDNASNYTSPAHVPTQTASALAHMDSGNILPTSTRKIERAKSMFDQCALIQPTVSSTDTHALE